VILIDRCRRTGESRQIEQLADRMLALDELSEEAIRAKMEARALAGDRLTALKVFEDWKAVLWQELHATPSAVVEQMALRMRRGGWERTVVSDLPATPPERGRERAFVGRAREYAQLYNTWGLLQTGKAIHSVVLGDSGVGKTTLVERFTTAAGLEGAAVARVQSYDLERNIPFATLGGLILGLIDRPGASATPPEALAELARTVPEVRRRFSSLPPPGDSQGEAARIRLTESFHRLLQVLAEEHPVVLVVDDLHLADEASLAVLHLVLRRAAGEPIMALFTARPAELCHSSQALILRESIARLGGQEVLVPPLSEEHCGELLLALLAQDEGRSSQNVRRSLIRASGGIPMVLELLVQDWRANGHKSIALALDAMTAEFVGGTNSGAAYGHLFLRLAGTLDASTRSALDLAAVLGHRLNDLSMYAVIDLSLGQTMAALGQLAEVHILREGHNGLEFANELIRAHAYSAVPSSVRRALHASVADRLHIADTGGKSTAELEIAWHTMRAGRINDAVPHLLEGARVAMRAGAPQSAERALASAASSLHGKDREQATFLLVEALQEQGRWNDSLASIRSLDGQLDSEPSRAAFALAALARGYLGSTLSGEFLELLPVLKTIVRSSPDTLTRLRAARAAAHAVSFLRDRKLSIEILELVNKIPTTELDSDARGLLGLTRALLFYQAGNLEHSFCVASTHFEELQGHGIVNSVAVQLQTGLGSLRGRQGRYEEAVAHQQRALNMAGLLGNDTLTATIAGNLSLFFGRLGRFDEQAKCAEETLKIARDEGVSFIDLQLTYSLAFAHGMCGRASKAKDAVSELETRMGSQLPRWIWQPWLLWKADALLAAGLRNEAMEAGTRAVCDYDYRLELSSFAGPFARWIAMVCTTGRGQGSSGREVLRALEDHLEDFDVIDQLEILCGSAYGNSGIEPAYSHRISETLRLLPKSTAAQLRILGMNHCIEAALS
jgi:tetratricopeptide (TPR) repeat protein